MTGKEIVQMAFELKEAPRVPVTLIGGGSWYVNWRGKTYAQIKHDPAQIADYSIAAVKRFGHDLLWSGGSLLNYPYHVLGCPIDDKSSVSPSLRGSVIDNLAEMDRLDIEAVLGDSLIQGIIKSHHLVADAVGQETMVLPTAWGPFTGASRILGIEEFMMASVSQPDELQELIAFCTEMIWEASKQMLAHPDVAGINIAEPVASGDMVSPETFRSLVAPHLKTLAERVRDMGKYLMLHICGDTSGILDQVVEIKPHCYSLEAKVDLALAQDVMVGKVCVAGQVSPTGAFLHGSPDEVKAEARACLDTWGDRPGFILTLGCNFPAQVSEENMLALMSFKQ